VEQFLALQVAARQPFEADRQLGEVFGGLGNALLGGGRGDLALVLVHALQSARRLAGFDRAISAASGAVNDDQTGFVAVVKRFAGGVLDVDAAGFDSLQGTYVHFDIPSR
jgi:hypothetical protein